MICTNSSTTLQSLHVKESKKAGTRATHGTGEIYIEYMVGKPEGKRSLGRTRRRWEDITKVFKNSVVQNEEK
jgi:hypothetical protein